MDYKKHIGDGKLPNRYWVFHYDEKFTQKCEFCKHYSENPYECQSIDGDYEPLEEIGKIPETKNSLLGEFKTYHEALLCIEEKAYLPHVIVEDRITRVVFETMYVICPCCRKEEFVEMDDISFTKKFIEERGLNFK